MKASSIIILASVIIIASALTYLSYKIIRNWKVIDQLIRPAWLARNIKILLMSVIGTALISILVFYPTGNFTWQVIGVVATYCIVISLFVSNAVEIGLPIISRRVSESAAKILGAVLVMAAVVVGSELAMVVVYLLLGINMFDRHLLYLGFNVLTGGVIGMSIFIYEVNRAKKELVQKNKELKISKLEQLKTKAELENLQSKINPHFLYNALNSIAGLIHTDPDAAEEMTLALSKFFRYSINRQNENFTTIKEEVEIAKTYLSVEELRFGDRLTIQTEIDPKTEAFKVPRFIIQPLVENAIKHGIGNETGSCTITIGTKLEGETLIIWVADSGNDFPEHLVPGYGIQSIYDKLNLLLPDAYELLLKNDPKQVVIKISKLTNHEAV